MPSPGDCSDKGSRPHRQDRGSSRRKIDHSWHCQTDAWEERRCAEGSAADKQVMARPPVEQLAPTNTTESVSWGEFTQVFGGNVDLKPYTADQADA